MPTLITGGTGFLGKYFIKLLKNSNDFFILTRDRKKISKYSNIIQGNLSSKRTMSKIKDSGFDRLIHFAWEGLPAKDPKINLKNYNMTKNLIKNLLESNPACELNLMGSCLEIEMNAGSVETEVLNNNNFHFAMAKKEILEYVDKNTENYRWFRIFYVFGVGQHKDSLINSIYKEFRKGKIPILKNIDSIHDYIFAEDAVDLIYKFITLTNRRRVIDIGTGSGTSNLEILSAVASHFGVELSKYTTMESKTLIADLKQINAHFPEYKFQSIESSIKKILSEMNL